MIFALLVEVMADNATTQVDPAEGMAIDVGSPTEIAEGDSDEDLRMEIGDGNKVKLEKRKRAAVEKGKNKPPHRARAVPAVPSEEDDEDDDEELDSPSKRPSVGEDKPLTAREIRSLLSGHVREMKNACLG